MLTQHLGCGIQSPIDVGREGKLSSSGMARPLSLVRWKVQGVCCSYCLGSAAAKQAGPPTPEMPYPHPEQQG